jgi:spore germination protein YaaH
MHELVFHDPTGRRARRMRLFWGLLLSLGALLVAGFFATLATAPRLPGVTLKDPRVLQALHVESAHKLKGRQSWTKLPHAATPANGGPARPLSVGFYVSWDESSRESLVDHVNELDVVSPQWIQLKGPGGAVDITSDPEARAIIASAKKPPSIMPGVFNARNGVWDGRQADALLADPKAQQTLIAALLEQAQKRGYAGYVFDLENLSAPSVPRYAAFLAKARAALKPSGREVWVTAPFDENWPLQRLQASADAVVLMAYDEHYGSGDPGPPAGQDWYETWLAKDMKQLDPARTIMALGSYGYDWTLPEKGKPGSSEAVTFMEATQTAHDSDAQPQMDEASLNPTYGYVDEHGRKHAVWYLDAATAHNQIRVADGFRPLGYALWRMGGEDQLVWKLMRHEFGKVSSAGLEVLQPGQDVGFDGSGEVLRVEDTPRAGHRRISVDPDTGLIAGELYDELPTSYVVQRYGWRPGWVALTFDDGPDGRWTPRILDILKQKHASATFFVIGKNMSRYPGLVEREIREGHDVGSHTWTHPNIGEIPAAQTLVELNATQRLFETITGRSMRLFRPPYSATPSRRRRARSRRCWPPSGRATSASACASTPTTGRSRTPTTSSPPPSPGCRTATGPARSCCCTIPAATAAARSRPCRG